MEPTQKETLTLLKALLAAAPRLDWYRWMSGAARNSHRSICWAHVNGHTVTVRRHDHRENLFVLKKWLPFDSLPQARRHWVSLSVRDDAPRSGRAVLFPETPFLVDRKDDKSCCLADELERLAAEKAGPGWTTVARASRETALREFCAALA